MRAMTVRQPWAWAIVHGGKLVENRTRNIAGSYRGPVAIHAGKGWSDAGARDRNVGEAYLDTLNANGWRAVTSRESFLARQAEVGIPRAMISPGMFGTIIGVVDLVDVHLCKTSTTASYTGQPCCFKDGVPTGQMCSPWALDPPMYHLELANPRPLTTPIPCRGQLGLWTPPDDVLNQLPTHNQENQR